MSMGIEFWIPGLGVAASILLFVVGVLNFSIFRRQLHIAREQITPPFTSSSSHADSRTCT
jgi:hypothetical protein